MNKIIYIACILFLTSCGKPQQKMRDQIHGMEAVLFSDSTMIPGKEKAAELMKLYIAYADKYKDDSASAEFLFKAGDLANNLHQPDEAVKLLGRVQGYQGFSKAPLALFLQGFIAETELNDLDQAKRYYELFLQKYPNHPLSSDVLSSLGNLGKSPEELIREFEINKQKQDSLSIK